MLRPGPKVKKCDICLNPIDVTAEKVCVEKHNMHKECFKCGICDVPLFQGRCAMDDMVYRSFGPLFFCPKHMMLGSGEKYEMLKKKFPEKDQ